MSLANVKLRYQNLPGRNAIEKMAFVSHWFLMRFLVARRMVDINCERCKPMSGFSKWQQANDGFEQRVVCLSGFGHSGSGAVADLLSEYDGVDVRSNVDTNGSLKKTSTQEFTLLHYAGGLFSLENAFKENNESHRDAALKSFLHFVAYLYVREGGIFNDQFIERTRRFLKDIIYACSKPTYANGYAYCPQMEALGTFGTHLVMGEGRCDSVFWLKDLSVEEYRRIAYDYVIEILRAMSRKPILVLDQAVSDGSADMEKYESYLGPIRLIAVYRDPRDVFATAINLKENWIPTDPDVFIHWYKNRIMPYLNLCHKHFKLIRFEDLVLDYESAVSGIEDFVGVDPCAHTRRKTCFDPARSCGNIGLFKSIPDTAAIRKIELELGAFCRN